MSHNVIMQMELFVKFKRFRILMCLSLILFSLLTFLPCVEKQMHGGDVSCLENFRMEQSGSDATGYASLLCCILSFVEILALCLKKDKVDCMLGFMLNLLATGGPILWYQIHNFLIKNASRVVAMSYETYHLLIFAYMVIGVGMAIAVEYVVLYVRIRLSQRDESGDEKRNREEVSE